MGFYEVLLGFIGFYWVLQSLIGLERFFSRVLLVFNWYEWVVWDFIRSY